MSNLLLLPQIPATEITITAGASWSDQFYVPAIGWSASPIALTGSITASSNSVTGLSGTSNLVPTMPLSGWGIPAGATISAISSNSAIQMSSNATATFGSASFNAFPPPLDLTGISFRSQIRLTLADNNVLLDVSTKNLMMVNGGVNGLFGWNVSANVTLQAFSAPLQASLTGSVQAIMDIIAFDGSGAVVDLGTINIVVNERVTR